MGHCIYADWLPRLVTQPLTHDTDKVLSYCLTDIWEKFGVCAVFGLILGIWVNLVY